MIFENGDHCMQRRPIFYLLSLVSHVWPRAASSTLPRPMYFGLDRLFQELRVFVLSCFLGARDDK